MTSDLDDKTSSVNTSKGLNEGTFDKSQDSEKALSKLESSKKIVPIVEEGNLKVSYLFCLKY